MNLEKVKAKVTEISRSTGSKHPKTLISELCGVIQSLIKAIEGLEWPKMTVLTSNSIKHDGSDDCETRVPHAIPTKSPREETGPTEKPGPIQRSRGPHRRFNAGDAE